MQLFTRDSSFNSVASALSLVIANYKPIPQLPTSNAVSAGTSAKQMVSAGGQKTQQTFQTQTSSSSNNTRDAADWGEVSVLYVPQSTSASETGGASQFASSARIGPGNCPVQQAYTPTGGWSALPPPVFPAFDPVMANLYRYRQQQGVNLGAW